VPGTVDILSYVSSLHFDSQLMLLQYANWLYHRRGARIQRVSRPDVCRIAGEVSPMAPAHL
jgi:hypothetical protein